ncbi:hypothetical protein BJ878DRAFT_202247 [Calycina marina]|uniref:Zn(2)-C6 fungal-type domain-containing protein n=1 Tax=Calycina marina TaxID=1763456 RepID=A0A9P7YYC1_9HELO|nr:hypothetical protein BJ878DRAFT_202247 [Calycina marina]
MRESSAESDSPSAPSPDEKTTKKDGATEPKVTRKPGSKEKGTKRTKTGCLTCRRRRIKCGEERPTCSNCTKSKRQCEGYSQRVVFKDPHTSYRGPPMSSTVPFVENEPTFHQEGPVPLAPKLAASFVNMVSTGGIAYHSQSGATASRVERGPFGFVDPHDQPLSRNPRPPPPLASASGSSDTVDRSYMPEPWSGHPSQSSHYYFGSTPVVEKELSIVAPTGPAGIYPLEWSTALRTSTDGTHAGPSNCGPASASTAPSVMRNSARAPHSSLSFSASNTGVRRPEWYATHQRGQHQQEHSLSHDHGFYQKVESFPSEIPNLHPEEDGDPYDVSEDEYTAMGEYGDDEPSDDDIDTHLKNNDLGVVVALQARQDAARFRSVTAYIDRPDMLSQYVPSSRSSPLEDPMTARVFCHFINVLGPVITLFDRHTANPALIFKGEPVPKDQQHNWTYTFPILALQNTGLLHAMCALASLHIAKLQNKSVTPSLRHYAYSIRRVAKSLGQPTKRVHPATLAAAMLLAFYEVWCADHQKWTNHLLGACMLVREIDFAGTTRYIKSMKQRQRQEQEHTRYEQHHQHEYSATGNSVDNTISSVDDVNENIVAIIMGKQIRYDQHGQVIDEDIQETRDTKVYTKRDLEIYENQRDLFWWYCKQDVYQSILGGGKLFMEYDRWSHCPPRAPLGRRNAAYGTFDHLVLLMGRLAHFMAKDLKRKQLAIRANGGYIPPDQSPPLGEHQGPQHQNQQYFPPMPRPAPQMSPFTGMMPVSDAKLPMGFGVQRDSSPGSINSDEVDLEALTIEAEEEWLDIRQAFTVLEDNFHEDFQALGPEYVAPIDTPFGPALQYRTYVIAGIWLNFYMALIVCHRAHTSMPPSAMVAAGISARHTAIFANKIGRIVAGIAPNCDLASDVTPGFAAGLVECTTSFFVAAVQYRDQAQRSWTITRLRDTGRLTGWETARAVVTALELMWSKAAESGAGPPYFSDPSEEPWQYKREKGLDRTHYTLGFLSIDDKEHESAPRNRWLPNGIM